MRIRDWSSDVCSSDLAAGLGKIGRQLAAPSRRVLPQPFERTTDETRMQRDADPRFRAPRDVRIEVILQLGTDAGRVVYDGDAVLRQPGGGPAARTGERSVGKRVVRKGK